MTACVAHADRGEREATTGGWRPSGLGVGTSIGAINGAAIAADPSLKGDMASPASGKCGLAGGQRGYFTRNIKACGTTISVTVIAGPLDYMGLRVQGLRIHP